MLAPLAVDADQMGAPSAKPRTGRPAKSVNLPAAGATAKLLSPEARYHPLGIEGETLTRRPLVGFRDRSKAWWASRLMALPQATGHSHRWSCETLDQITGAVPPSVMPMPRSRSAASKAAGSSGVTNGLIALPVSTRKATALRGRLRSKLAQ